MTPHWGLTSGLFYKSNTIAIYDIGIVIFTQEILE